MKNYIVYNQDKKIQRTGSCPENVFFRQAGDDDFVIEGKADDAIQKMEFNGFDGEGQPINPRVVDKTPEEIEAEKPPVIPFEKQAAHIANKQWQDVLKRLDDLEKSV